jgi:hypothetical protein
VVADHAWRIKTDSQCPMNQPCGRVNLLPTWPSDGCLDFHPECVRRYAFLLRGNSLCRTSPGARACSSFSNVRYRALLTSSIHTKKIRIPQCFDWISKISERIRKSPTRVVRHNGLHKHSRFRLWVSIDITARTERAGHTLGFREIERMALT